MWERPADCSGSLLLMFGHTFGAFVVLPISIGGCSHVISCAACFGIMVCVYCSRAGVAAVLEANITSHVLVGNMLEASMLLRLHAIQ